jgi:hypothetical protein
MTYVPAVLTKVTPIVTGPSGVVNDSVIVPVCAAVSRLSVALNVNAVNGGTIVPVNAPLATVPAVVALKEPVPAVTVEGPIVVVSVKLPVQPPLATGCCSAKVNVAGKTAPVPGKAKTIRAGKQAMLKERVTGVAAL